MAFYVSNKGLEGLRERRRHLERTLKELKEEKARAYDAAGDGWHDNPYFNKLQQDEASKMGQLAEVRRILSDVVLFEPLERNTSKVRLGSIVRLKKTDTESQSEEVVWEIVGYGEGNLKEGKLAYNSPLAQAILGLEVGTVGQLELPDGIATLHVLQLYSGWSELESD